MKVCIAGKNEIAVHGLMLALERVGREYVVVCPNRNDHGGPSWQPSLLRFAKELGVRIVTLEELESLEDLLFLSLEFDRILRCDRFRTKRLFNVHFSLLPSYKGVYTSAWPILNGDAASGVTLHRIDRGIDTGDIVSQRAFALSPDETARSLYLKYLWSAAALVDEHFSKLLDNYVEARPQSAQGSTYYSKTSINYANLRIDLNQTANNISRQVRAFSFREYQIPQVGEFPCGACTILDSRSQATPGTVVLAKKESLTLASIDYDIEIQRDWGFEIHRLVEQGNLGGIHAFSGPRDLLDVLDRRGWSPLMIAAFRGREDICRALLNHGVAVDSSNVNGTTALMYAKNYCEDTGDFSICDLLMRHGADASHRDRFGRTALDYAILHGQRNAIGYFGSLHGDR